MVSHAASRAKCRRCHSPFKRVYLRFRSRTSTLAGKKWWLFTVRLQQAVIVKCGVVDTCGLISRLHTWRSITNGRSEVQLKTREGA